MKITNVLGALAVSARWSRADFTNSFTGITSGSSVTLTWGAAPQQDSPLCITAQLIDKTGDGTSANAYRANITVGASGTSYVWTGAPYPLRWKSDGLYQLELRPMSWSGGGDAPLLAVSPSFSISSPGIAAGPTSSATPQPTAASSQGGGGGSGLSKPAAIGLGVAIGVPSIAALVVVGWCFRKRQRRAALEKRQLKRSEFVIT